MHLAILANSFRPLILDWPLVMGLFDSTWTNRQVELRNQVQPVVLLLSRGHLLRLAPHSH